MKREHLRRMKPYHPRRSRTMKSSGIQELKDLEHKLSGDIGAYIVLIEEGTKEQIEHSKQKARGDLLKFGPDMQKIAKTMGTPMAKHVQVYLASIDAILHASTDWIDEATIAQCFQATRDLEEKLVS